MYQLSEYQEPKLYKKNIIKFIFWELISFLYFNTPIPGSKLRVIILKLLGCVVGKNCIIKPNVKIKYPWKLNIGNSSWIGENVWIDNIATVTIGNNTCISQGTYICSATHNFEKNFELLLQPVVIGDNCWIAAKCIVGPKSNVPNGTFLKMGRKFTSSI